MERILSYFYFTGEDIDGNYIEADWPKPMSDLQAEFEAKAILRHVGGGHIDAWYSETDELAFSIEI